MRNAYNSWCRSQAVPWVGAVQGDYAAQQDDGPVLVADDADVSVISAHTARMAADALVSGGGFMPLQGFAVAADGSVAELDGTLMADLAGLPAVWPPEEPPGPRT
jgi:hypothetical protein